MVAAAEFHVLQRVGEALYLLHDLAALERPPEHGVALLAEPAVTLSYGPAFQPDHQPSLER